MYTSLSLHYSDKIMHTFKSENSIKFVGSILLRIMQSSNPGVLTAVCALYY